MKNARREFAIVAALIVALLLINVAVGFAAEEWRPDEGLFVAIAMGLLIGQYIGQLNLISVWAAVTSGSVIVRLPWAMLLTVLMWGTLVFGKYVEGSWDPNIPGDSTILYGFLLAFGCLVTQIPLWIASRVFRWQLVVGGDNPNHVTTQFNLRQMFVGTVLLAGSLAICRWLLRDVDWRRFWSLGSEFWEIMAFVVTMAFFNLIFVVPSIWAAFLVQPTIRRLVVATFLLSLVGPIELVVIVAALGNGPSRNEYPVWCLFFSMLHLGQVFVVYGSLLLLRYRAGFRILRVSPTPAATPLKGK